MENGCASKVLAVGSSIELSSRPSFSELLQVPTASEVDDLLLPWPLLAVSESSA